MQKVKQTNHKYYIQTGQTLTYGIK